MAGLADDVFVKATRAFTVWLAASHPAAQTRRDRGAANREPLPGSLVDPVQVEFRGALPTKLFSVS